jgi:hypothetical protein
MFCFCFCLDIVFSKIYSRCFGFDFDFNPLPPLSRHVAPAPQWSILLSTVTAPNQVFLF